MLLNFIKNKLTIRKSLLTFSLSSFLFFNSSCAIIKYSPDLILGEFRVLHNTKTLEEVLEDKTINEEIKNKLKIVKEAKQFAIEIGLKPTNSFETINLVDSSPLSLYASPKDKLELKKTNWLFFESEYLPFFNKESALKEKKTLEEKGYDVYMTKVLAYSTLGWFNDPIFRAMLNENEAELSDIIFHEIAHETFHNLKNINFTEGAATFIGMQGAIEFMLYKYGENSLQHSYVKNIEHDNTLFINFITEFYTKLDHLYEGDIPKEKKLEKREKIFLKAKNEFKELKKQMKTNKYDEFDKIELNNAYVLAQMLYLKNIQFYHTLHNSLNEDVKKTIDLFKRASRRKNPDFYLSEWSEKSNCFKK